jgi:hypothetical protein
VSKRLVERFVSLSGNPQAVQEYTELPRHDHRPPSWRLCLPGCPSSPRGASGPSPGERTHGAALLEAVGIHQGEHEGQGRKRPDPLYPAAQEPIGPQAREPTIAFADPKGTALGVSLLIFERLCRGECPRTHSTRSDEQGAGRAGASVNPGSLKRLMVTLALGRSYLKGSYP